MKHYDITKNRTGKELTNYLGENLQVEDAVRYQLLNCTIIAKHDDYFWLVNSAWIKPITGHISDMDIMEGM